MEISSFEEHDAGTNERGRVMTFGKAVGNFWRNYVGFSGRATRAEYWWAVLFITIVAIPLAIVDVVLFEDLVFEVGVGLFLILFMISLFLPYLSLLVRRFHDVGMSGWLVILAHIPYVGGFLHSLSPLSTRKRRPTVLEPP